VEFPEADLSPRLRIGANPGRHHSGERQLGHFATSTEQLR
jgi:hypothetical protein